MKRLLQINTVCNSGSTGRIAEELGLIAIKNGWESYIAFGRGDNMSASQKYRIGDNLSMYKNALMSRLLDSDGFEAMHSTNKFITYINEIKPDLIHIHNLHGYFLNIKILFEYLKKSKIPVVWTFHDCWPFTGHCSHFDFVGCEKWKTECYQCEQKTEYPKSLFFDRSRQNFIDKKRIFTSINNLTIVPVSNWLSGKVKDSFLKNFPCEVIKNGIDLNIFYPKKSRSKMDELYAVKDKFVILGVATAWGKRKGLEEFVKLSELIDSQLYAIVLVGLSENQIQKLPKTIIGIQRTENVDQLADLYSAADVFVNPTLEDSFPTTNLEALACGTPVITYRTGGSVESVNENTGIVVDKGHIVGLTNAIESIKNKGKVFYEANCRESAIKNFDKEIKFNDYLELYKNILKNKNE